MEDEEPLCGEFLRLVCAALSRNAIKGFDNTACVLVNVLNEKPLLRKPPQSEARPKPVADEEKGAHHVLSTGL